MWTSLRFRLASFFVGLLFCGSVVLAQEATHPDKHQAADHGDAHAVDAQEFAREELRSHRQESYVGWMIRSMGLVGLLVLGAGFTCFVLTLFIVIRGQGPFACAALVFIVPIPFWLGLFGTLKGLIASLQVIAMSDAAIKASEISDGVASSLLNPMLGLVMMAPSYLVATLGSIFRSFVKPAVKP
ncbi:MAG: hypothetical protein JWP89_2384 [Schlesneria sp.]|nr:hypothetical protein [Schlesneria sp.]